MEEFREGLYVVVYSMTAMNVETARIDTVKQNPSSCSRQNGKEFDDFSDSGFPTLPRPKVILTRDAGCYSAGGSSGVTVGLPESASEGRLYSSDVSDLLVVARGGPESSATVQVPGVDHTSIHTHHRPRAASLQAEGRAHAQIAAVRTAISRTRLREHLESTSHDCANNFKRKSKTKSKPNCTAGENSNESCSPTSRSVDVARADRYGRDMNGSSENWRDAMDVASCSVDGSGGFAWTSTIG